MLDPDKALPGFKLLKISESSSFPCSPTMTLDGNLISSKFFLLQLGHSISNRRWIIIGNSWTMHFRLMSILTCYKCHKWPTVAKPWLFRFRPSGWPSHDIISKMVDQGYLLVPVEANHRAAKAILLNRGFPFLFPKNYWFIHLIKPKCFAMRCWKFG